MTIDEMKLLPVRRSTPRELVLEVEMILDISAIKVKQGKDQKSLSFGKSATTH